ncbi:MAG: PCRF domain-containing protein [Candidatus Kaiserbacteria bacterium]|nr:PCRF domain-containing protein [Candidatus Kaiserbacteria bacterium]
MEKKERERRVQELEAAMALPDFWEDKEVAQRLVREYTALKQVGSAREDFPAVLHIIAGAGGDDAEDFVRMLATMYQRYAENKGFAVYAVEKHETPQGGYKNISIEIANKQAYGLLKHEVGVHRLVRVSPFNAKKQRHTSFALVDVVPKLPALQEVEIPEGDLEIDFTGSGGPGGQHVNKRETAVRVKHAPSGIAVRVERERSQAQNKEVALEILRGKLFALMKQKRVEKLRDLSFDKTTDIEWGNQIRSYVLHPYKMVKDLRVQYEEHDPDAVLDGELDGFIAALKAWEG